MLRRLARRLMSNVPESTVYGGPKPQSSAQRVSLTHLRQKHRRGQPITVVTAYDYPSAVHVDSTGIDILLVGDSAAMVVHGHDTTLPITLDDMLLHCRAVARGASRPLLIGDLPFGFYESSASQAVDSAVRMLKEGGMDAIKLEGASPSRISAAKAIVEAGVAVMGHVGLTPQAISILGGFRPQGKTVASAVKVVETALALQDAGCFSVVLECVPAPVAAAATSALHIPTIGIGAGPLCSGQPEKIMSNPRGGRLLVRFHRLTEAARSAIAVPPMASVDGRTSTTGSKRLGLMANVAKRKQSFLQFFLMTGVFMLSMRSLSQKYRIRDLSDENALLAKERDAIALRSSAVKEALFQEAALDPSGLIADHVRSLFDEKPDH